jgi:hypothetical protein
VLSHCYTVTGDDYVVTMPTKLMGRCFMCFVGYNEFSYVKDQVTCFHCICWQGTAVSCLKAVAHIRQGRVNCTELTEKAEFTFFPSASP